MMRSKLDSGRARHQGSRSDQWFFGVSKDTIVSATRSQIAAAPVACSVQYGKVTTAWNRSFAAKSSRARA